MIKLTLLGTDKYKEIYINPKYIIRFSRALTITTKQEFTQLIVQEGTQSLYLSVIEMPEDIVGLIKNK